MSRLDACIDHLRDLVAFPTVSSDSNLAMIAHLANRLEDVGARCRILRDDSGRKANLFASLGPDISGGIVLSGHTDVVPVADQDWATDPFALSARDGLLYGRGTCDMKGFIAACLAVAPVYADGALRRPLHFCFTHDEETGCLGAQALVAEMADWDTRPGLAIIGEPTSMRLVEGHKGCCEYTTTFHGLAGHGSNPDLGVSATEYAARFVARLLELRGELAARAPADSRFTPPGTTVQVGGLRGGIAHNVIAELAEVDWELRPVNAADKDLATRTMRDFCNETLLPAMRAVHEGSKIETETIGDVAGLEPVDDNEAARIVSGLTGANGADVVAFGTEAGLFQKLGLDAVVCGPGDIAQAHKPDEFVSTDQLAACLAMLEGLDAHLRA
ncbi:acetylornithine deacetylase [Maribius pontilimi]|uniref:Acetylornithine deacetylase n=1 Tax=Palleronia pontilimi TaxID=1964209 RepID=A0A934I8S4_9RHOB|nr:acetylornithine deacetylase [Palleronia pontilimi]MBJ3762443.1 acetylornithine deacetylase [Palleronia pontilimi]